MSEKISLTEWVAKYNRGEFNTPDVDTMIDAGWYDWFCKDKSLFAKMKKMVPMVLVASKSDLFNPDKVYVFFKNNCPVNGPLYDSFSICDLESGDVIYWVTAKSGHTHEAEIMGVTGDFDMNLLPEGKRNVASIKRFFNPKVSC